MKNVRTTRLRLGASPRRVCFAAVVLFLCACPALGTIEFNDGQTHDINYQINDNVWVDYQAPTMYTTVNWLDGGIINYPYILNGYERSRINIRGGSINYCLFSEDSSQVDISGGEIRNGLFSYDSSHVNISGGSIEGILNSYQFSQVNISGGEIRNGLFSYDSSHVNISGGSISTLNAGYFSQVNISGGSINGNLCSWHSSQTDISGGLIGSYLLLSWLSRINIFGSNFAVDGQAVDYGELTSILGGSPLFEPLRHLTGTLANGELINNDFYIGENARIVLIPEPTTLALLSVGILYLRRRK